MRRTVHLDHLAAPLNPHGGYPLHVQIYSRLKNAVLDGQLPLGTRLPSTRALADELGVSRTTVLTAYGQLLAEGYIEGEVGAGTRVVAVLPGRQVAPPEPLATSLPPTLADDGASAPSARGKLMAMHHFGPELRLPGSSWNIPFRVALPALDAFPIKVWSRLLARHARRGAEETFDYQDGRGLVRLRVAIASHLAVSRGLSCAPEQILVTAGAQSAIDLAIRVLTDPGDVAIVENPCHLGFRGALAGAGLTTHSVDVDEEGMGPVGEAASRSNAKLVCVTPSNQFPMAVTLSVSRRMALLEWATRNQAWIIEDDYDSEFRYAGRPVEALQALDLRGRVIYVGSFSKVMFPGLRLGYMIAPPSLVDSFLVARRFVDVHPPELLQAAVADFITEGHFARHIRSMRAVYGERAAALKAAIDKEWAGLLTMKKPNAGMHAICWLPSECDDRAAAQAAARAGLEVRALSAYAHQAIPPGLVLGFGTVTPSEIISGVKRLSAAISGLGQP